MANIRILIDFRNGNEWRKFKIAVGRENTVAHLQFKIRKFIKLKQEEACYLFFQKKGLVYGYNEVLYGGNKLLTEIQDELHMDVLKVKIILENTFGDLNRRFTNATISELKNGVCWILTIHYSYYNMYNYSDTFVFPTMEEAIRKLCLERTDSKLIIKDKNNVAVNIEV